VNLHRSLPSRGRGKVSEGGGGPKAPHHLKILHPLREAPRGAPPHPAVVRSGSRRRGGRGPSRPGGPPGLAARPWRPVEAERGEAKGPALCIELLYRTSETGHWKNAEEQSPASPPASFETSTLPPVTPPYEHPNSPGEGKGGRVGWPRSFSASYWAGSRSLGDGAPCARGRAMCEAPKRSLGRCQAS